jgi:hypothetical protein
MTGMQVAPCCLAIMLTCPRDDRGCNSIELRQLCRCVSIELMKYVYLRLGAKITNVGLEYLQRGLSVYIQKELAVSSV